MKDGKATIARYVTVLGGGMLAVSIAAFLRYSSQIKAFRGAIELSQGRDLGITTMASGMFGSIIGAMLLGTVVMLSVLVACWLTLDVWAGLAAAALGYLPIALFNLLVARFLIAHPVAATGAAAHGASYVNRLVVSFNDVLIPALVGLVIGFFVVRSGRDRLEREANRPVIKSKAERDAEEAEFMKRDIGGTLDPAAAEAPQEWPAVATHTAPAERVAVICSACGASNVPQRSVCLRCGAALTA